MKLLLVLLAASCGPPRPTAVEPVASDTPWCLRMETSALGPITACAVDEHRCQQGRSELLRLGGFAGIEAVGECWDGGSE